MTTGNPREGKTWWLSAAAVFGLGLLIVFFDLEGYRTLTKHEGFVAVVSREMRQTGDWVVPRFGGLPRLKKPPLAYWSAASAGWLFGEDSPWTARFPFAVSALLLAGIGRRVGRQMVRTLERIGGGARSSLLRVCHQFFPQGRSRYAVVPAHNVGVISGRDRPAQGSPPANLSPLDCDLCPGRSRLAGEVSLRPRDGVGRDRGLVYRGSPVAEGLGCA